MPTKRKPKSKSKLTPEQIQAGKDRTRARMNYARRKVVGTDILVNILLDRSGSMAACRAETISGFNEYIAGLRADTTTRYRLTFTQFDSIDGKPELYTLYTDKPLADVPGLIPASYEPRGLTPLYDAIGASIGSAKPGNRPVLMVILTDGENNASVEFNLPKVKALISAHQSKGWTFVFIGADINAYSTGNSLGLQTGNTVSASSARTQNIYQNLSTATATYAEGRRSTGLRGQTTGESFFTNSAKADMGDTSNLGNVYYTPGTTTLSQPMNFTPVYPSYYAPAEPEAPSPYVTIKDAAKRLNISKYVLYGLVQSGKFPATKLGRHWRIHQDNLNLK